MEIKKNFRVKGINWQYSFAFFSTIKEEKEAGKVKDFSLDAGRTG